MATMVMGMTLAATAMASGHKAFPTYVGMNRMWSFSADGYGVLPTSVGMKR